MRLQIQLSLRWESGSGFSLWCGSGYDLLPWCGSGFTPRYGSALTEMMRIRIHNAGYRVTILYLIILTSSPTVTWSGMRNLVLSRTGSCFSPENRSMMQGILTKSYTVLKNLIACYESQRMHCHQMLEPGFFYRSWFAQQYRINYRIAHIFGNLDIEMPGNVKHATSHWPLIFSWTLIM